MSKISLQLNIVCSNAVKLHCDKKKNSLLMCVDVPELLLERENCLPTSSDFIPVNFVLSGALQQNCIVKRPETLSI